jgi:hypothetical protein
MALELLIRLTQGRALLQNQLSNVFDLFGMFLERIPALTKLLVAALEFLPKLFELFIAALELLPTPVEFSVASCELFAFLPQFLLLSLEALGVFTDIVQHRAQFADLPVIGTQVAGGLDKIVHRARQLGAEQLVEVLQVSANPNVFKLRAQSLIDVLNEAANLSVSGSVYQPDNGCRRARPY